MRKKKFVKIILGIILMFVLSNYVYATFPDLRTITVSDIYTAGDTWLEASIKGYYYYGYNGYVTNEFKVERKPADIFSWYRYPSSMQYDFYAVDRDTGYIVYHKYGYANGDFITQRFDWADGYNGKIKYGVSWGYQVTDIYTWPVGWTRVNMEAEAQLPSR